MHTCILIRTYTRLQVSISCTVGAGVLETFENSLGMY